MGTIAFAPLRSVHGSRLPHGATMLAPEQGKLPAQWICASKLMDYWIPPASEVLTEVGGGPGVIGDLFGRGPNHRSQSEWLPTDHVDESGRGWVRITRTREGGGDILVRQYVVAGAVIPDDMLLAWVASSMGHPLVARYVHREYRLQLSPEEAMAMGIAVPETSHSPHCHGETVIEGSVTAIPVQVVYPYKLEYTPLDEPYRWGSDWTRYRFEGDYCTLPPGVTAYSQDIYFAQRPAIKQFAAPRCAVGQFAVIILHDAYRRVREQHRMYGRIIYDSHRDCYCANGGYALVACDATLRDLLVSAGGLLPSQIASRPDDLREYSDRLLPPGNWRDQYAVIDARGDHRPCNFATTVRDAVPDGTYMETVIIDDTIALVSE